jgi:hypothetical protein
MNFESPAEVYKKLDEIIGQVDYSEDMTFAESLQFLVNQRDRLNFIIAHMKKVLHIAIEEENKGNSYKDYDSSLDRDWETRNCNDSANVMSSE